MRAVRNTASASRWIRGLAAGAVALGLLLTLAPRPRAEEEEKKDKEKPTYDTSKCNDCHEPLMTKANVHSAIDFGDCSDCHWPNSDGDSKCEGKPGKSWKLAADEPQLCFGCHEIKGQTELHSIIELGGCTACHNAHSADNPNNLLEPPDKLCVGCHEDQQSTKNVHMPVEMGECIECHNPHVGVEKPLLKKPKATLCFECHDKAELLAERVDHAPVREGSCLGCHSPHGSDNAYNTLRAGNALCLECHDSKAPRGIAAPRGSKRINMGKATIHGALDLGECQDCHFTHTSKHNKLLKKPPPTLCYECHDRKDTTAFTHSAVTVGDCAVCHDPHSANNQKLLRSTSTKRLCFRCHEDDLTGRRFIHKPAKRGKCGDCHNPHGADNPYNLKAGEGKAVCYSCHEEKDKGKNKHKVLERYGCTACHDPHGTANQFFLARPVNKLCQSCHTNITDGLHASTFIEGGHKISGGPDPHNPERDFSCASCHNPHGSDSPKILRYGDTTMDVCDWCHGDKSGKNPELKDISRVKRAPLEPKDSKGNKPGGKGQKKPDAKKPTKSKPRREASARPPTDDGAYWRDEDDPPPTEAPEAPTETKGSADAPSGKDGEGKPSAANAAPKTGTSAKNEAKKEP